MKGEGIVQEVRGVLRKVLEEVAGENLKPVEAWEILDELENFRLSLQSTLEYLAKNSENKSEWQRLYGNLARGNASTLCEKLRGYGYRLRRDPKYKQVYERVYDENKKQPKGLVYRILELTRLGKRDEVFFSLFNIFQGEEISSSLAQAFSPIYSDDLFRTFVYSFLSGLLGPSEKSAEEVEEVGA